MLFVYVNFSAMCSHERGIENRESIDSLLAAEFEKKKGGKTRFIVSLNRHSS
jgi:hypothetical protein